MKIYREISLSDFEFWGGALGITKYLTEDDFNQIEDALYSSLQSYSATDINDLFWFEPDYIAQILGYAGFEDLGANRSDD